MAKACRADRLDVVSRRGRKRWSGDDASRMYRPRRRAEGDDGKVERFDVGEGEEQMQGADLSWGRLLAFHTVESQRIASNPAKVIGASKFPMERKGGPQISVVILRSCRSLAL